MSDSKNTSKQIQRDVLPIPDKQYAGFVAYDAKDPDSKFAPIEQCCVRRRARRTS